MTREWSTSYSLLASRFPPIDFAGTNHQDRHELCDESALVRRCCCVVYRRFRRDQKSSPERQADGESLGDLICCPGSAVAHADVRAPEQTSREHLPHYNSGKQQ